MNNDRIDDLLEQTLSHGSIPADATQAERVELASLLGAMGVLQSARNDTAAEARATMPTARARFQRYVTANQPQASMARPVVVPSKPRPGFLGRLVGRSEIAAVAGSAAGVAVLVLAALLVWQVAFTSPTSAYAQVVDPGDYVQVEGVVEQSSDGRLQLQSELGRVDVELSETTALVDRDSAQELSTLKRGDRVLVGGIAGEGRKLAAQTLALSQRNGAAPPRVITFKQLERLRANLEGQVVTYTISSNGAEGSVLIQTASGERLLVRVDGRSAEELLRRASTALGQRVKVREGSGVTAGTFGLEVPTTAAPEGTPTPTGPGRPAFVSVRGVVTAVEGRPATGSGRILDGSVTVLTLRGPVIVIVRLDARVLAGDSGLSEGAGLRGEAIGHTIFVSGGLDKKTGNVIADVIVMGPSLERPQR